MTTLFPAFAASAKRYGASTAISDDGRNIAYSELYMLGRRAGRALMSLGIEKGDRVAIWAVNHADWVVAGLGIQAAGAVLVLIGTRLKGDEAAEVLRRSGCKAIFMDAGVSGYDFVRALQDQDLPELNRRVVFGSENGGQIMAWNAFMAQADEIDDAVLDARIASVSPDEMADLIFTSGTTGRPKGVPMTHAQSLIACAQQQLCVARFEAGETYAVIYPFAHNAGYRAGWQGGLLTGTRIIPVRNYEAPSLLDLVERNRVAVLQMAPTLFQAILEDPTMPHRDLSSLRYASTGGTVVPVGLVSQMRSQLGARQVATGYGLTESAGSVSNTAPGDSDETVATTTGRALKNLEVRILDREFRDVPVGEPGEIAVRGPQILRAYYQDEKATAKSFTSDGFFLTGDIGRFTSDLNLRITDRIKDMYICGGFNCYPAEIEGVLRAHQAIEHVAVIGVADARMGEVGRAFIVPKPGMSISEDALLAWAKSRVANYKVPRSIMIVDTLPINATGKVNKVALRALG